MKPKAALCLLGAVVADPATAQAPVPRAPVLNDFGACAARQGQTLAQSLMATRIDSRQEYDQARQLMRGNFACANRRLVMSWSAGEVRGTVAEALIEQDGGAVATLRAMPSRPAVRVASVTPGRAFVAAYGACIADAEPAKAVDLLATAPQSPEEQAAFLAFGDTLNDCMPLQASYRIDRFDVRNHIAAQLYQRAFPSQSGAS